MNKEHQESLAKINDSIENLERVQKNLESVKVQFATNLRHDLNLSISHFAQILGVDFLTIIDSLDELRVQGSIWASN